MESSQSGRFSSFGINPLFSRLWAASAASNLGDGIWLIAAPLLAATLTRDPVLIAGISVAQRLPWLLFGLLSGALADRLDRRHSMIVIALVRASLVGLLGMSVLSGWATIPLLYLVFFVIGTGETLFDTSASALLPALVDRDDLARANGRLASTMTVTNQFAGPPLGGLLFSLAASIPFLIGAIGLAAAAGLLKAIPGTFRAEQPERAPQTSLLTEINEGMRWLWSHRLLRTMALSMAVLNITVVAQVSIMVLYAEEHLGLGAQGFGVLVTLYGVGGVMGGMVAGRILARTGASTYLRLAIALEAMIPAAMAVTHQPIVAGIVLAIFGLHAIVWGVLLSTLRQELTPDRLRGRVKSVTTVLELGTAAPGALFGGVLTAKIGLTAPFWAGTVCGIVLLPLVWSDFSPASIAAARREAARPATTL